MNMRVEITATAREENKKINNENNNQVKNDQSYVKIIEKEQEKNNQSVKIISR